MAEQSGNQKENRTGDAAEFAKQVRRRSGSNYLIGIVVGFLLAAAVFLFSVFFLIKKGYLFLGGTVPIPQVSSAPAEEEEEEEGLLDKDTMRRIELIEGIFTKRSIYDLDEDKLRRGMIDGLVEASGDKYARYYNAEEYKELMQSYDGVFYGIGALVFTNDDGWTEISSIIEDGPASKTDLRPGDLIVEVDGESTKGLDLTDVVNLIHGVLNTDVTLTIYREGEPDYLTITVTRGLVKNITVSSSMKTPCVGYIRIQTFEDVTAEQFAKALAELEEEGMQALVLDLRSNTGGLLTSVVDICDQILPAGTILSTKDVNGSGEVYTSDGKGELKIPIVVLTNGATASASEILTGALKDYEMAVTLGTKTYGKGVVQTFVPISDGSALKLTTEQYFTAKGNAIDGVGIAPDIELELDAEKYLDKENPVDNQLEAAIDFLEEELAEEAAG